MKRLFLFLFVVSSFFPLFAQSGFRIAHGKHKTVIPFKFINNLIIIPLTVNGTPLNFLLDTGVEQTLLFSLEENEEVRFSNLDKIMFRGIGSNEPFEGLKSAKNIVSTHGFTDTDHTIYIVLNQDVNISSQVGIPVNGIIGYYFFKDHVIDIDYNKRKIVVYNSVESIRKKLDKKYQPLPITIEEMKPYLQTAIKLEEQGETFAAKLLIDIGNSDALWLFSTKDKRIRLPERHFDDYLGMGFSGTVYGKRCRINKLQIADFNFENPIAALPDSVSTQDISMVPDRVGSIGSEIMKRFSVVFDYAHRQMYLKKNSNFKLNFNYNMSGLEIQHSGLEWVNQAYDVGTKANDVVVDFDNGGKATRNFQYKFELKPTYSVFSVRKDSPSALAGLQKGDEIKTINGRQCYNYTLEEINQILKSEENRLITIEVMRKNQPMKFSFRLKNMI